MLAPSRSSSPLPCALKARRRSRPRTTVRRRLRRCGPAGSSASSPPRSFGAQQDFRLCGLLLKFWPGPRGVVGSDCTLIGMAVRSCASSQVCSSVTLHALSISVARQEFSVSGTTRSRSSKSNVVWASSSSLYLADRCSFRSAAPMSRISRRPTCAARAERPSICSTLLRAGVTASLQWRAASRHPQRTPGRPPTSRWSSSLLRYQPSGMQV